MEMDKSTGRPVTLFSIIKMTVIGITVLAILSLITVSCMFLYVMSRSTCDYEIFQEFISPDDHYKAEVYSENCGATSGYMTGVSILNTDKVFSDASSTIFLMDNHPQYNGIIVVWNDNQHITISYTYGEWVRLNKDTFRDQNNEIEITYNIVYEK
jgi:hypothetical protein